MTLRLADGRGRLAYYVAGAVATGVYFLLRGRVQAIGYEVIGAASVVTVLAGGRRHFRDGSRRAWELFALGLAFEVAGDATYTVYDYLGKTVPTPSIADVLYLVGYPLLVAGVAVLLRELGGRMSRAVALDAVIAFAAVTTLQWTFVIASLIHVDESVSARIVDLAYPCADVLLFGAVLQLLIAPTPRSSTYRFLTAAVAAWLVGDEIYLLRPASYTAGDWLDVTWLAAYVLWGAAALQPAGSGLPFKDRAAEPRLTRARATVIGVALLAIPATLAYEAVRHGRPAHVLAAAIGIGVISILVLVRLADLLRAEIEARHEAESMQGLLVEQNAGLRQLDRMKDEFVAAVSHELRTPLTSISGYTDLLDEGGDLSERQTSYLRVVARNTDRLLDLVNDLLFVGGMQDGQLALDRERLDVTHVARQSVESAGPNAEARGVRLRLEANGPAPVDGDPGRLAQLIDNLVSNAVKFTPAGGDVVVRAGEDGAGSVVLEVTDSGIGIPEDEQPHLFDRFFRSSNAVAKAIPGTGLGLYITRAIAHAHGGEIEVESLEGSGSRFVLTLPRA